MSGTAPVVAPGAENLLQSGGFAAEIWGYQTGDQIEFSNMTCRRRRGERQHVDLFGPGTCRWARWRSSTKSGSKARTPARRRRRRKYRPCFAAGTRIETVDGPVGSRICVSATGVHRGRRRQPGERAHMMAPRRGELRPRIQSRRAVWPVRVHAGAFGENVPVRDLYPVPRSRGVRERRAGAGEAADQRHEHRAGKRHDHLLSTWNVASTR